MTGAPQADKGAGTAVSLLERESELELIGSLLDQTAAGSGGTAISAAPAGIGKTKLLEAAVEDAPAVGARALVARATEIERGFAFGVVRQLLEPAVVEASEEQRAELFAGAARTGAATLELDPDGAPDRDIHATMHGLYWLLVNLSNDSPLLVAVDDLQWVDEPSLRWLAYVSRRLERLPIAVLLTARTAASGSGIEDPDASESRQLLLDQLLASEGAVRLQPPPLSAAAVAAFLARRLDAEIDPKFAAACRELTGGNPFLVSELAAEVAAEAIAPNAAGIPALEHLVPDRVGETINRHLMRLTPEARELAAAVAILGDGGELAIAAELAAMEGEEASRAASELVAAQILDDSRRLSFRHPLLRGAVEARVPAIERGTRHGQAAKLLATHGAPSGRIAAHLLLSLGTRDPVAVEQLRSAARAAQSQGVPEQAAALLRRALAEPPPAELRPTVLRELGTASLAALEPDAGDHLEAALDLTAEPGERADLAWELGIAHVNLGNHQRAVDVLKATIEEVRELPDLRERWLRLEAALAMAGRYDLSTESQVRGRIHELAESLPGETAGEELVRSMAATERPGPSADDLFRATARSKEVAKQLAWPDPGADAGTVVMFVVAHRPDAALALAESMMAGAVEQGSPSRNALALVGRGVTLLDLGDLRSAEADLTRALELASDLRLGPTAGLVGQVVQTLLLRGKADQAEAVLVEHELLGDAPEVIYANQLLYGRGLLRLAQSRWEEAETDLRELGRRQGVWKLKRPSPSWRSACAQVRLALGDRAGARELAAAELELALAWDTPKSIATATRALALTESGEGAIEGLEEAVALLEDTPWKLDRAQARCDLGSALRRTGRRRDSREHLALAMDEADACGAEPLVARAADELRASGARPRRRAVSGIDALTPSERRVAMLAAEGKTNREIAQELFVTMATVETHLTRVYRKLDVEGRRGLADALAG